MGLLRITEEYTSNENKTTELALSEEMSTVLIPAVYNGIAQIVIQKSIFLDLEWFDSDQTKFEDWWRRIQLFLKNNRAIATDDKITAVLAQLREGIAEIYVQKKIDQIEEEEV